MFTEASGAEKRRILAVEMATEGRRSRHDEIAGLLRSVVGSDFDVDVSLLPKGPKSLETGCDVALAGPGILERVARAEREGYSAVLICGALDPCLDYARSITRMPVIGAGRAACLVAAALGRRVGFIATVREHIPFLRNVAYSAGLRDDVVFRSIDIPIPQLRVDLDRTLARLTEEGRVALDLGADVLVLGCTSISESGVRAMSASLGAPVVHPNIAGALMASAMVRGSWSHSLCGYGLVENWEDRYGDHEVEL